jgi:hypothetical protein
MAQQAVMSAVNARLAALWSHCDVVDDSNDSPAPPPTPFLAVQYSIANEHQISIGSPGTNLFRESGAIRFVLTIAPGSGSDWAVGWMDELRSIFRAKQFGGVNTWAPSSPALDDRNSNGGFWQLTFAVPYYFDFLS